jgi:hypothetical protein
VLHVGNKQKSGFWLLSTLTILACVKGGAMYRETESLTKLLEQADERQQCADARRSSGHEQTAPQIKMIVSDWYTDELGNQARFITASD